jgi:ribosomal protein S13
MTNIEALNSLLAKLNLPNHRKVVELNGRNLSWVKKHVDRTAIDQRMHYLLDMNVAQLKEPYAGA